MQKDYIKELQKKSKRWWSENKLRIMKFLIEKDYNISQLQRLLNIKYKSTWEHVYNLHDAGYVSLEKSSGKEVIVSLNKIVRENLEELKLFIYLHLKYTQEELIEEGLEDVIALFEILDKRFVSSKEMDNIADSKEHSVLLHNLTTDNEYITFYFRLNEKGKNLLKKLKNRLKEKNKTMF